MQSCAPDRSPATPMTPSTPPRSSTSPNTHSDQQTRPSTPQGLTRRCTSSAHRRPGIAGHRGGQRRPHAGQAVVHTTTVALLGWDEARPNYFAIPFGIIGLSFAWQAAATILGAPDWIGPVLLILAAGVWMTVCVAYLTRLVRQPATVHSELGNPALSPFIAFAPMCVVLLGAGLVRYAHLPGQVIVAVGITFTMGYGSWWMAGRMLGGGLSLDQVYSAYLIPVSVGGSRPLPPRARQAGVRWLASVSAREYSAGLRSAGCPWPG